jgi:hypothetical protein
VGGGGNFHLRTQVQYYTGFVTYQFQFHVSVTYLMVFRPPPTPQLLHCLAKNISNMTTGRKRFYPPPPILYVFVKWNGIRPILHKFICILFYYDIIDSNSILQTLSTLKYTEEGSGRKSGICILLQVPSLSRAFPPGIHLFRQSACLTCQILCLTWRVVSLRLFRIPFRQ